MNNYDLLKFLSLSSETVDSRKIYFQGAVYPLLFFNYYISFLKKNGTVVQQLDVQGKEFSDVVRQLEMQLFGNSIVFWLKDLSGLSDSLMRSYVMYLQSYQGPHRICFFITEQNDFGPDSSMITFPEIVQEAEYRALTRFFMQDIASVDSFISKLFMQHASIAFETALLIINYQMFLGRRSQDFTQQWLPRIIVSEKSLFTLSQYFFARNYHAFLNEWSVVKEHYPDEFWLVFWSEQVWQALIFINHAQKNEIVEARRKVYRLPFSFMNKDWRNVSEKELMNAHTFLYEVDCGIKNGRATDGIDLFVHKFLLQHFK